MSSQAIMQVWGVVFLLLSGAAFALLLTRKREAAGTRPPRRALLDFSANQEEGRQMQARLAEALAVSATDTEFEQKFRDALDLVTGSENEKAWVWLERSLAEYRQGNQFEPSSRVLAARFLADIPRRYRLK